MTDDALRADLTDRLARQLDFRLASVQPLASRAISTNRLLRLRADDGREAVAKVYYRDGRDRLEREYGALSRLQTHGVAGAPRPLLRWDELYYGVYSLAPGAPLPAASWTPAHAADLARFAADLYRLRHLDDDPLPVARGAMLALADRARAALQAFLEPHRAVLASPEAPPTLLALHAELRPADEIERLAVRALEGAGPGWRAESHTADLRLTNGDAGAHNVLVAPDGGVTVVDFESSGWDHPLAFVTDFLTHDQTLGLSPPVAEAFLSRCQAECDVPEHYWRELARACALRHVFWCGIHLSAANPAIVGRRSFNDPAFDPAAYLDAQITKLRRRLEVARAAVDSL